VLSVLRNTDFDYTYAMVSSPFLQYPKSIPTLALFGAKDRSVKKFIRIHQLETMLSTSPLHTGITRGSREPVIAHLVKLGRVNL
jgi:hypothetical protein